MSHAADLWEESTDGVGGAAVGILAFGVEEIPVASIEAVEERLGVSDLGSILSLERGQSKHGGFHLVVGLDVGRTIGGEGDLLSDDPADEAFNVGEHAREELLDGADAASEFADANAEGDETDEVFLDVLSDGDRHGKGLCGDGLEKVDNSVEDAFHSVRDVLLEVLELRAEVVDVESGFFAGLVRNGGIGGIQHCGEAGDVVFWTSRVESAGILTSNKVGCGRGKVADSSDCAVGGIHEGKSTETRENCDVGVVVSEVSSLSGSGEVVEDRADSGGCLGIELWQNILLEVSDHIFGSGVGVSFAPFSNGVGGDASDSDGTESSLNEPAGGIKLLVVGVGVGI